MNSCRMLLTLYLTQANGEKRTKLNTCKFPNKILHDTKVALSVDLPLSNIKAHFYVISISRKGSKGASFFIVRKYKIIYFFSNSILDTDFPNDSFHLSYVLELNVEDKFSWDKKLSHWFNLFSYISSLLPRLPGLFE